MNPGDTCARPAHVGDWLAAGERWGPCPGTLVEAGRQTGGKGRVWLGCDRCGWVGKAEVEAVQEVLL